MDDELLHIEDDEDANSLDTLGAFGPSLLAMAGGETQLFSPNKESITE